MNSEFADLCREFPAKRLVLRSLDDLSTIASEARRIFYVSGTFIAPLGQSRQNLGINYPICAFSHALDLPLGLLFLPGLMLARDYDSIITSSTAGKKVIETMIEESGELLFSQFGCNSKIGNPRIDVIPLGVDLARLYPRDKLAARNMLNIPPEETVLLYLGRFSEEHKADLEPLFIVFRHLLRTYPNLSLLLAGADQETTYHKELEAMAVRFGVRHKVYFLVNFQDFLKPFIYSAADVLVSPVDNIQETFGISIVEAMACGLPVVTSDWSGYKELVEHGKTGFLVPTVWNSNGANTAADRAPFAADGIRRHMMAQQTIVQLSELYKYLEELILNRDLRAEFGAAAVTRVRELFSWQVVVTRHENLWKELWAIAVHDGMHQESRRVDDWNRRFRHFATKCFDVDIKLKRSSIRNDLSNALQFRFGKPGYASLDSAELFRVIERTSVFSVSARELIESGTASVDSIVWLLKKGYVRVVE